MGLGRDAKSRGRIIIGQTTNQAIVLVIVHVSKEDWLFGRLRYALVVKFREDGVVKKDGDI